MVLLFGFLIFGVTPKDGPLLYKLEDHPLSYYVNFRQSTKQVIAQFYLFSLYQL